MADALERVQVTRALQLMHPHLGQRVQRCAAGQDPDSRRLALPRDRSQQPVVVDERHLDRPAAYVGAERDRLEHIGLPTAQQRPRRLLGFRHVLAADPQLQPPSVLGGDRLRPHGAERAPQPGGELLAPLGDHGRGHPVGQVNLGPPPGPVLAHRGREHQGVAVADPPVDPGDTQAAEGAGDDVLGSGPAPSPGASRQSRSACAPGGRSGRAAAPRRRRAGSTPTAGRCARMTSAATTTTAQPSRMYPRAVRVSFPALWIRRWSESSPSAAAWCSRRPRSGTCHQASSSAGGAGDPDQRPPGGQHEIGGCADAVVGGGVPLPGRGELHMLAGRFPGAPVGGDDRLARRAAIGQVGVRGPGGLGDLRLGARVGSAQRQYVGVVLAVDAIG